MTVFEELPPTVYIGIGAVIAAAITALISFVNLITSKDQTISDNRQKWIDAIREDISKFIGLASHFSSRLYRIETTTDETAKEKLLKELFDLGPNLAELYNRIYLRLNPEDDQEILASLKAIEDFLADEGEEKRHNTEHMSKLASGLREKSQEMLKTEWKRVKRGETTYLITKWSFIIAIISSLSFGVYKIGSDHNSNAENRKPVSEQIKSHNKSIQPTAESGG